MARRTVIIPLATPITGHAGPISRIVLREPSFDAYMEHGEPYSIGESPDGTRFGVENMEVVRAYIPACLVEPADPLLLEQADMKAAREVRKAILGFFRDDAAASEASETSPTTSSST